MMKRIVLLSIVMVVVLTGLLSGCGNELPVPSFSFSPEKPQLYEEVVFDASGSYDTDGHVIEWQWLQESPSGEKDLGTSERITTRFLSTGTYNITLRVKDSDGGIAETSETITIYDTEKLAGVCFSPFRDNESPNHLVFPTEAEIREDTEFASGLAPSIRTYGVSDSLNLIPQICESAGIDCYPGAWISDEEKENEKEIQNLLDIAAQKIECVRGLVVGNEVLLRNDLTVAELVNYIDRVKGATDIPVGTAECWATWLDHPELADSVDILLVHIHPYWDGISIDDAADFVLDKWQQISNAYPGKRIIIGETGWPSGGDSVDNAIPSEQNERQFMQEFSLLAKENGIDYFYFSLFDEEWKGETETIDSAGQISTNEVESFWGIYNSNGTTKTLLVDLLPPEVREGIARPPRELKVIPVELPLVVYADCDSPQNRFYPSGFMGEIDAIDLDTQCTVDPFSGDTCIEISFTPGKYRDWAGIYWQYPLNNWGEYPGYSISENAMLSFYARGAEGGEKAEFKVGGIRNEEKTYSDSFGAISTGVVELTSNWEQHTIMLDAEDLSMIIGGFCWVTDGLDNPEGCTIYVDEVQFETYVAPIPSPTPTPTLGPTPSPTLTTTSGPVVNVEDAFVPSGWMGDLEDITLNEACTENPHSGSTCIKITYSASGSQGNGWAGIYWLYPDGNWGNRPEGWDLTGATRITFWARGEVGGEMSEFKAGGISTGLYPDSIQPPASSGIRILTSEWKQYTIDLTGKNLSHVIGGFCWVTNKNQNPSGCTIYLDDIEYSP